MKWDIAEVAQQRKISRFGYAEMWDYMLNQVSTELINVNSNTEVYP